MTGPDWYAADTRRSWALYALGELLKEMDPDATITGVVIGTLGPDGTPMHYALGPGTTEIQRHIITPQARRHAEVFASEAINATPDSTGALG